MSWNIKGKEFTTKAAIAREYNLHPSTIQRRLERGLHGEQLVAQRKKTVPPPQRIHINGVGYKSIAEACYQHGVPQTTYYRRLRHGATRMQALGLTPLTDGRRKGGKKK